VRKNIGELFMINENESCAKIIGQSDLGVQVCSAAARISTTEGTAFSVFNKSQESDEANVKLIGKVLNSGHKTIIEHHCFNLAFNNVSVIVEQFLIEFRLTSFTIKSRRYVDFSNAGYYMPNIENEKDA
jgi:thymidylate synthase (FAD)